MILHRSLSATIEKEMGVYLFPTILRCIMFAAVILYDKNDAIKK